MRTHPEIKNVSIWPPPESWNNCFLELLQRLCRADIIEGGTSVSLRPEMKSIGVVTFSILSIEVNCWKWGRKETKIN